MECTAAGGDEFAEVVSFDERMRGEASMENDSPSKREEGQTMAEYAVVLGVITLAIVTTFAALSGGISAAVNTITGRL